MKTRLSNYLPFTRETIEEAVPKRFEHVAAYFPDRIALTGDGQSWSYESLNRHANRMANAILANAKPGTGCVAFLVEQSPEMVITVLAILKAGKAYLGVHPGMPAAVQREILLDAAPELILTTDLMAQRAGEISSGLCRAIVIDEIDEGFPDVTPGISIHSDSPSTIFYTSGSTGRPKGVVKRHGAVMHRVWLSTQHDRITHEDRQSLLTHCAFSASESDIFGVLLQGARLCVFDVPRHDLSQFRKWIDEEGITLFHPPVLLFRSLLSTLQGESLFPSIRLVALAGDVVLPQDIEKWKQFFHPACALLHRFATSETALLTVARFDHESIVGPDFVPAGMPVADKHIEIVDEKGTPVEEGKTGELLVHSRWLSDGYWRRPKETSAVFRTAPNASGERSYRTGDMGRFLNDGSLVFVGRQEHLAKIRGFRVDAREVEVAMMQLEEILAAAVVVCRENGEDRLWAFWVQNPEFPQDVNRLREKLRERLPEWKIPSRFEPIPVMPTLLNGKIDRPKLMDLVRCASTERTPPAARSKPVSPQVVAMEEMLMDIWRLALDVGEVKPDDNFLDLGGSSISAIIAINWIERIYGARISPAAFLKNATVMQLAAVLQKKLSNFKNRPAEEPLRHEAIKAPVENKSCRSMGAA